MKKLTFDAELRDSLKDLRERLGIEISDDSMSQVVGGYCGGTCYITCSWYCRQDRDGEEIP